MTQKPEILLTLMTPLPQTSTPVKGCPAKYKTPEKVVKLSCPVYCTPTPNLSKSENITLSWKR